MITKFGTKRHKTQQFMLYPNLLTYIDNGRLQNFNTLTKVIRIVDVHRDNRTHKEGDRQVCLKYSSEEV